MAFAIWIALLNIRSGNAGGLEAALQALRQGNVGMGILQENEDNRRGTHALCCGLISMENGGREPPRGGGILVVQQEEAGCQVKGVENFGPNVVIFLLMLGAWRCYVLGAYMPPNDVPVVHRM